jgi:hypothetical protein
MGAAAPITRSDVRRLFHRTAAKSILADFGTPANLTARLN